tara:strand:+ start:446 stop:688 length:243 start_codon:yes stop_codon:yes gene_type:complete
MPRYTYFCESCEKHFEVVHSMMESQDICLLCESENIKKIPAQIAMKLPTRPQKVGDIVKDHIKMSKEELKQDKISSKKEL